MFAGRFSGAMGVIGIDLGIRAVKMLQLRRAGDGFRVAGAARIEAPVRAGDDWTPSIEQIVSAVQSGGFTGRRCIVSLPRHEVHIKAVQLPKMTPLEMQQAAAWEAAHRFDLSRDALEVDFLLTGAGGHGGEGREEALLVAASHASMRRWVEPLLDAGLRPVAIDVDFAALGRLIIRQHRRTADHEEVRAVVDFGYTGSSILILRGGEVVFHKEIKTSGRCLNKLVAEHLDVDVDAARELRRSRIASVAGCAQGPLLDKATDRAVYEATRPMLNDLVNEVVLCLRYYGVTFRGRPPVSIVLTGGDGLEPQLDQLLEQACKIPVVVNQVGYRGDLSRSIREALGRRPGPEACWLVAAGLSLRGITERRPARSSEPAPTPVDDRKVAA